MWNLKLKKTPINQAHRHRMDWWLPEVGEWMASEMGEESQKVQISSN